MRGRAGWGVMAVTGTGAQNQSTGDRPNLGAPADPGSLEQLRRELQPATAPDDDSATGRIALLDDPPVADADRPVGELRGRSVVRGDDHAGALLPRNG